jgi:hypothetical protein
MSLYIALQDLCFKKSSPRSVALEKSTGGIKVYSEKSVNCCLQIGDYTTGFDVNFLSSHGDFVSEDCVQFGGNQKPNLNVVNNSNSCEFSFSLKCSSQKEKCYYFMVVSWITASNRAKFLVSCALAAYSKNAIYDQSIDNCSYISTNYLELDLKTKKNGQMDIFAYSSMLIVRVTCYPFQCYIVHQDTILNRFNQRLGVSAALFDIDYMLTTSSNQLVDTSSCAGGQYSAVFSLVQSFRLNGNERNGNLFVLESILSDLQTPLADRNEIHMEFDSSVSRSNGQLFKGTER